jgi:hypothetical protein
MAADAQGALTRLYIEPLASPHVFDANSETYEFVSESLKKQGRFVGGTGIRGTRSSPKERTRVGAYSVGGRIMFHPDPAMLDLWLPRILGGTEVADSFPLAETLPIFGVLVNRVTTTFEYTDCQVSRAMFHAAAGPGDGEPDLVELAVEIMAKNEVVGSSIASPPGLSTASNAAPYVHSDATFSFNSAARQPREWWILIDNHLEARWVNSLTATRISARDRTVVCRIAIPYDDDAANLYTQSTDGASGTVTLTNGNMSTLFTFANLKYPVESPVTRGKTELELYVNMIARSSGATKELVITHDSVN